MLHSIANYLFLNCSFYSFFRTLLRPARERIKLARFSVVWRHNNTHNLTSVNSIFPIHKVKIGRYTYGELNVHYFGTNNEGLEIGDFCSIADNVHFILGGNHQMDTISTYPFYEHTFHDTNIIEDDTHYMSSKGKIIVDSDVWFGHGVIVLSGSHIGQGAVIGAGSVVAQDIPPYAIFCKNKVIKFRFDEIIRNELQSILDWGGVIVIN